MTDAQANEILEKLLHFSILTDEEYFELKRHGKICSYREGRSDGIDIGVSKAIEIIKEVMGDGNNQARI